MGISLFLFATVNTEASNIGLNAMVRNNFEYFSLRVLQASAQHMVKATPGLLGLYNEQSSRSRK